jgi:DNA-binding IclR family transcriptional regulator
MTLRTITDPQTLRAEIERIHERGYAVDDEELSLGLRCVGVPIFDYTGRPAYAMSVSAPALRMSDEKIEAIQTKLRSLCRQISRQIGAPVV